MIDITVPDPPYVVRVTEKDQEHFDFSGRPVYVTTKDTYRGFVKRSEAVKYAAKTKLDDPETEVMLTANKLYKEFYVLD